MLCYRKGLPLAAGSTVPNAAILLVLVSAVLHASWNLAAKKGGGTVRFAFISAVFGAIIWAPVNLIYLSFHPESSPLAWSMAGWIATIISAVVHAFYFVILLHGYAAAPLSIVYPVARGTGPLLSATTALFVFQEELTGAIAAGIALTIAGVVLLALPKGRTEVSHAAATTGIRWGAATGIFIALYTVVDAYAIKVLKLDPIPYDYWVNFLRMVLLVPFIRDLSTLRAELRSSRKAAAVVALLSPAGYILVLFAMQISPLTRVAPARELSMLFGALFGGTLLREGEIVRRMSAALLIACGVILLTLL